MKIFKNAQSHYIHLILIQFTILNVFSNSEDQNVFLIELNKS